MKYALLLITLVLTCSFSFAADNEVLLINVVKEPTIIYVPQPQVIYIQPVYYQPLYYYPRYHPHPRHNFRFSLNFRHWFLKRGSGLIFSSSFFLYIS
jgi:hypothetical protein